MPKQLYDLQQCHPPLHPWPHHTILTWIIHHPQSPMIKLTLLQTQQPLKSKNLKHSLKTLASQMDTHSATIQT
jgi:hypothetical protein